jgi:hypothetical protein
MTSIICSDSSGIWVNKILKDYFLKGYAVSKKIDRIEDMESVIQPILIKQINCFFYQEIFDFVIRNRLNNKPGWFGVVYIFVES